MSFKFIFLRGIYKNILMKFIWELRLSITERLKKDAILWSILYENTPCYQPCLINRIFKIKKKHFRYSWSLNFERYIWKWFCKPFVWAFHDRFCAFKTFLSEDDLKTRKNGHETVKKFIQTFTFNNWNINCNDYNHYSIS